MKRIYTLLVAFGITTIALAQGNHNSSAMRFSGKASFAVASTVIEVESDTVLYAGTSGTQADITIPQMTYNMGGQEMTIPSFTIHNATFAMDMATMTATFANQTYNETLTVDGVEKAIIGQSLEASYKHDAFNTFTLSTTFKYGNMPMPITYQITAHYIKGYTNKLDVTVGGTYKYNNESVTYDIRTYPDGETTKLDVKVPAYVLQNTMIGDLTIGSYTVKGLTFDEAKGGYYRDYIEDGLTMHFIAEKNGQVTMNDNYPMNTGTQDILVVFEGRQAIITNNFKPGNMPFPICSTFPGSTEASISSINRVQPNEDSLFNLVGQRVNRNAKGLLIKGGKKYFSK